MPRDGGNVRTGSYKVRYVHIVSINDSNHLHGVVVENGSRECIVYEKLLLQSRTDDKSPDEL